MPERVQADAELGAVAVEGLELRLGQVVRLAGAGGDVVVGGGHRAVGPAHAPAGRAQPLERLRARHLVHQVQVDEEQVVADHVIVPDLPKERARSLCHGGLAVYPAADLDTLAWCCAQPVGRKTLPASGSAAAAAPRWRRACAACGATVTAEDRFCGECGTPVAAGAAPALGPPVPVPGAPAHVEPATERRLVSVLFADLVGFTTVSEARDSEEVRALLSRYFDTCRRLIELYGGVVEKFIGDAVMAVWGAHNATEDDAERAVRAALDLVAAVTALGDEIGVSDLHARAGVLTGEATVTLGAAGEGMVAGDIVNTAARIQTLAEPGRVLVGETTRRATEPTIVYEDAGTHELKGKVGLHRVWQAVRVVSGARGALKSEGLEAPFVGRDRELRQIKDLFHACAEERRAHLVSVTGIAGIGKSRVVWEFYKYFDGLAQIVYWHRGRCLAYGEGVTYWALADMVRMRCRISEDEPAEAALAKLAAVLDEHIPDADERAFVEPRVAHLLGIEGSARFERDDLFSAWRIFFERLADVYPTVLAFEDMQWADASLLDFIEHLLEWSRNSPLYVITAARPELVEKRQTWGAGKRNFTSLYLEPLPESTMRALLAGLVPDLPDALAAPDPGPVGGCAAVCGRDGANAARPRPPRPAGQRLQGDRAGRDAGGARDAACADRRPARRPEHRRAAGRPERGRAGKDVHA